VGHRPNGGYLLATILGALGQESPFPDLLAIHASFLAPAVPGAAEIATRPLAVGTSIARYTATLQAGPRDTVHATATFGVVLDVDQTLAEPPPTVSRAGCEAPSAELRQTLPMTLIDRLDFRFAPGGLDWTRGVSSDLAGIDGWVRLRDGRAIDARAAIMLLDVFPPSIWSAGIYGSAPTLDFSAAVHRRPASRWFWLSDQMQPRRGRDVPRDRSSVG